ncbi:YDG domain-containing protein [Sphingorhabdus sp.]|uniref:YDG domain-containing protein n=1 Tax=Sphingorhabdus sp. TaxID=1902408 RepID=UPI0037CBDF0D
MGTTVLSDYAISYVNNTTSAITPYIVSLTGGRVYDATTSVAASTLTIGTLINQETLGLAGAGTLGDKNVGQNKAVGLGTLTLTSGTGLASNYTLVDGGRIATITVATISTVSGITATDKTYNANDTASLVTSGATFNGMFANDVLNVATSAGAFDNARAAIGKTVSISGITLGGADAGNYTLTTSTASTTATINPFAVTVTALSQTKAYDSNTSVASSALNAGYSVGAMVNSESLSGVTLAYADANVSRNGSGTVLSDKTIVVSAAQATAGTVLSDYAISYVNNTASTITPYIVSLTGGRVYDATTSVAASTLTIGTLINQETLGLAGAGTLGDKNVGQNKAVGLGTLTLTSGTGLASNYTLVDGGRIATITVANLTVTTSDVVKTYNGSLSVAGATTAPVAIVSGSATRLFGSDTLSGGSYAFTDANAGTGNRTVTVGSVTVNDGFAGGNYNVSYVDNTSSTINRAAITVSTSNVIKTYDATTSALGTPVTISGSLFNNVSNGNTTDSLSGGTYAFVGANVSRAGGVSSGSVLSDKVVTASDVTVNDGNGGGNYVVTYADNNTSTINPYAISLTGGRVYDGTTQVNSDIFSLSQRVGQETLGLTGVGTIQNSHVTLIGTTPQSQVLGSVGTLALTDGAGLAINYTLTGGTHNVTVNQRPLTLVAVIPNKIYDGNTAIPVTSLVLENQVAGEALELVYNPFANFNNKAAGENKPVTIVNIMTQTSPTAVRTDYVTLPTTYQATASIFKKDVTVVGVVATDKVYDGTTSNIINTSVSALAGLVQGDQVSISNLTGTFSSKNVGTDIPVIGSEVSFGGLDAGNYNLIQPTGLKANILPRTLIASATGVSREYDGTTNAQVNISDNRIAGDIITYDYSGSFLDENIGTNKFIAVQVNSLTGTDGGNYTLAANPSAFANVARRVITFTPVVTTKMYDGTTSATGTLANNVISGDNVTVTFGNMSFADPDVGVGKLVTATGISVTGDLSNYSWSPSNTTATGTGAIVPYIVDLTGTKIYDGTRLLQTTAAASHLVIGTLVSTQTLTLTGSGTTSDRNIGTAKTVDVSSLTLGNGTNGGRATNYTLVGGNQSVNVIPAALVITSSDAVKTYDGAVSVVGASTAPAPIVKSGSGTQLFGADSLSGGLYAFTDANVSRNANGAVLGDKSVTVSGVTLNDGNNGANYTVTYAVNTTSTINPYATTITALPQTKVYDASTVAGTASFSSGPMIGSDAIASVTLTYDNKNVGQGTKLILPSSAVGATGTILGNYNFSYVADTASSITPAVLSGVSDIVIRDKVYDGTMAAEVASASFNGIYAADDISVALSVGSFDTKDVGVRSVVISGISLGGSDASNYILLSSSGTATGQILQRPITIRALSQTKVYDGTTQVPSLSQGTGFDVSNLVQGEGIAAVTLSYADPHVGRGVGGVVLNNKTVTISGAVAATNTDLANYAVTYAANTTSTITPAPLKVTVLDLSKMYDGIASATGTAAVADDTTRLFGSDTLSGGRFTFANVDAGTNKTVNVSSVTINDGNFGGNYAISYVNNTTSVITPYVVSLTGGRVYDATTDVAASALTIGTLVGVETLGLAGAGTLGDKNIGQNKAVGLGTLTLISGTGLASNYTLLDGSHAATITPASLTLTTSDVVKTYDGGLSVADARVAAAPIVKAGSNTQLFGLDSVSGGSYAFTSARAGSGNRTVTVAGVTVNDGNNGQNYAVTYASNTTSTIDPKALTVTALSQTKVYDSNTSVASSALNVGYGVSGLVGSESLSGVTLAYSDANVSRNGGGTVLSDKTIAVSAAQATAGTVLSDYAISYVNNTTSAITPFIVSLTGGRVYDATTSVAASTLTIGTLVNGEQLTLSGTGTLTGTKDVGTAKTFDISTLALGNNTGLAFNYTLVGGTRTADITRATISTVSGITATNKTYDSNDTATLVTSGATFNGMFTNDVLNVATSTGVFNNARAAIGKTVSISGITLGGADAGNYTLTTSTASTSATIDPKALTVTALSQTKVYDSNTSVASSALNVGYGVSGLVGSESLSGVTLAYSDANVSRQGGTATGTVLSNKTIEVSAAQATVGTTVLSDYAISYVNNTSSAITPKLVSLSAAKVYDGNTGLSGSVTVTTGIVGEVLGYSSAQANSAEVGAVGNYIRQIVLVSSLTSSASNYILPILDASTAPVLISMPLLPSVTMSMTYDRLAVANAPTSMLVLAGPVMVASLNTSGQGFISVDPINTPSLDAGKTFEVAVPVEAFRNARSDAQITLSVNLPDGSALPTWVAYDEAAAVLRGTSPGGIAQLDVEVTAVDEMGNKISTIINLKFSEIN